MKMVCKKLLSLVLVALMLVSAVPFQASADEVVAPAAAGKVDVPVTVYINNEPVNTSKTLNVDSTGVVLDEALAMQMLRDTENREFVNWMNNSGEVVTNKTLDSNWLNTQSGYSLSLYLTETQTPPVTEHTHTWDGGKVTKEPTCTETGVKTYHCTTPDCTGTMTETIPMVEHTYKVKEVSATCGKDGSRTKICSVCGAKETETIKATGNHTWGGWVITKEATATEEGVMTRTCKVCGKDETQTFSAKTKTINFKVTLDANTETIESTFVLNKTMSLPKPSVPSGYQFKGWFTEPNGKGAQLNDGTTCTENLANVYYGYFTQVSKFPYSVYLHIYESGNIKTPLKTVTLDTWTCVKDGVVTLDELKEVIKTYYTAKTSDGIGYDGIYWSTSSTKTDYIKDENQTDRIEDLDDLRSKGYVHLNVWIGNAKAKSDSNSNSSSSNPKTGDTIYMAVTVMGLSAASLAAVYYISKKRAVR